MKPIEAASARFREALTVAKEESFRLKRKLDDGKAKLRLADRYRIQAAARQPADPDDALSLLSIAECLEEEAMEAFAGATSMEMMHHDEMIMAAAMMFGCFPIPVQQKDKT